MKQLFFLQMETSKIRENENKIGLVCGQRERSKYFI